jgi:primosomal protein N' (replication factor Y)
MLQVAGRAGRRDKAGEVVIQTADPIHPVFAALSETGYQHFATSQLKERQMFNYPPFCRLIRITMRHADASKLAAAASLLGQKLRFKFGSRILGPVTPLIDRIRGELIVEIILKIEVTSSFAQARATLAEQVEALRKDDKFKNVTIICNVDPV